MSLEWCILAAFIGSRLGDQLYFWSGRSFGAQIFSWRPAWHEKADRALSLLVRYQNFFILSLRFIHAAGNIASFAIGFAGVSFRRFAVLNGLAVLHWALSFGLGGCYFGKTLKHFIGQAEELEAIMLGVIVASLGGSWLWRRAPGCSAAGAILSRPAAFAPLAFV